MKISILLGFVLMGLLIIHEVKAIESQSSYKQLETYENKEKSSNSQEWETVGDINLDVSPEYNSPLWLEEEQEEEEQTESSNINYRLGADTMGVTVSWADKGSWSDWQTCEDVHGNNSAVRTLSFWELTTEGHFEKGRMSCRTIEADGTFASGDWTNSDYFFNTNDDGDEIKAEVDMDKLPVAILIATCTESGRMRDWGFGMGNADDIVGLTNYEYEGADWELEACGTGYYGHIISCDPGYVVTGMKVKSKDASWPYNGQKVYGFKFECTKLLRFNDGK